MRTVGAIIEAKRGPLPEHTRITGVPRIEGPFAVPQTAFKVNVAQQLGLADPPTDAFNFGLPYFNATNYSLVTDSPNSTGTTFLNAALDDNYLFKVLHGLQAN